MALFEDFRVPHSQGNDTGKLILRLAVGVLLLLHGMAKIQSPELFEPSIATLKALQLPPETAWFMLVGELVAPVLIIVGIFSRFAGAVIAMQMALITAVAHLNNLTPFLPNGGYTLELEALFLFAGMSIAFLGSGVYALVQD